MGCITKFVRKSRKGKMQTLRVEFDTVRMKDAETIEKNFNHVLLIIN